MVGKEITLYRQNIAVHVRLANLKEGSGWLDIQFHSRLPVCNLTITSNTITIDQEMVIEIVWTIYRWEDHEDIQEGTK